jgi:hypothetical protein
VEPTHIPPSVTWYRRINRLCYLYEIRHGSSVRKVSMPVCRENWLSDSDNLITIISTFLDGLT